MHLTLNRFLSSLFFLLIVFPSVSQIADHTWIDILPLDTIPTAYADEDAIIIHSATTLFLPEDIPFQYDDWMSVEDNVTVLLKDFYITVESYRRIKILTKNGLQQFAYIITPIIDLEDLLLMDARTIKQSGEIIEVNKDDIKESVLDEDDDYNWRFGQMRFAIPGVEVGDEVEIIFKYKMYGRAYQDDVFLNSYLPSLSSEYIINIPQQNHIDFKLYNGFEEPDINFKDQRIIVTFSADSLQSIYKQINSSIYTELPYFSSCIYESSRGFVKNTKTDWPAIYHHFTDIFEQDVHYTNRQNYVFNYLIRQKFRMDKATDYERFTEIFYHLKNTLKIRRLKEFEEGYHVGYYMYHGFINNYLLRVLYCKIFDKLKMKYYLCLGREKQLGPIDKTYLRPNELTHVFFMIQDDEGKFHFVYPHTKKRKYEIDELPPSLCGTTALLLSQITKDSVEILETKIPEGSMSHNYRKRNVKISIDLENKHADLLKRISLSGAVSTLYRMNIDSLHKNPEFIYNNFKKNFPGDDSLKYDTAYVEYTCEVKPYNYRYVIQTHEKNMVNFIGDNIYSLDLKSVIYHKSIKSPDYKRTMNYINKFPYSDLNNVFLLFSEPVNLVNAEDFVNVDTDGFKFQINQLNPTTINIISDYSISKLLYPPEEYKNLVEINKAYKKTLNASLLIEKL
ncbi:MAG: DUF3857 domain-containing protein [Bacteroidales bacterium]|nr:DUF3857 domain-containing protein [Bacteroidales bacterium]